MSDEQLRNLERAFKATGADADGAALLCERVRVGQLTQENMELAAYVGDPAARIAVGKTMQPIACSCRGEDTTHGHTQISAAPFDDWAAGLSHWGREACVRAAVAAAHLAIAAWERSTDAPTIECSDCDRGLRCCSHGRSCNTWKCATCAGTGLMPDTNSPARQAIRATEEWIDEPWIDDYESEAMRASGRTNMEVASLTAMLCYHNMKEEAVVDVVRAAIETHGVDEAVVREAIKAALLKWCLA